MSGTGECGEEMIMCRNHNKLLFLLHLGDFLSQLPEGRQVLDIGPIR